MVEEQDARHFRVEHVGAKQGIELVMTKWFDTATFKTRFTFDTLFGTNVLNTEMAGILLFNQAP